MATLVIVRYCATDLLDSLGFVFDGEVHGMLDVIYNRCGFVLRLSCSVNTGSQKDGVPSMSVGAYVRERIRIEPRHDYCVDLPAISIIG